MKSVKIILTGTNREYDLTAVQVEQFARELSRTAPWRTCRGLISYLFGLDRYQLPFIAPDATIQVTSSNGRNVKNYTLHGRTVLQDLQTKRKRQFYMGAVILEWVP